MKLFLDTNIIIDVIAQREPFFKDSKEIQGLCENGKCEGTTSAMSFCTIAYVLRKNAPVNEVRTKLYQQRNIQTPRSLTTSILDKALASKMNDIEDAVQFFTAAYADADYIITRNIKDFTLKTIPAITPTEFLESVKL